MPTTNAQLLPSEPNRSADVFSAVSRKDVLLHHPYESFATSVQAFLEQAAADPDVLAIKQTLYRTSGDSPIVEALIDAAESGKQVLALVEIKARFDEAANITWARKLEKAGVHVVYGLVGLKTHCKLALVIRQEKDGLRHYSHIGTGNYNPKTSRIYEDLGLLTADDQVGKDLTRLFNELSGTPSRRSSSACSSRPCTSARACSSSSRRRPGTPRPDGRAASASRSTRWSTRRSSTSCTARRTRRPRRDLGARHLQPPPGIPELSENITVRSILGRYLEHSRIFTFHNDGEPVVYIGSADMMHRNLDRRVEALVRLVDPDHVAEIGALFDEAMSGHTSSWHLGGDGVWTRHSADDAGGRSTTCSSSASSAPHIAARTAKRR